MPTWDADGVSKALGLRHAGRCDRDIAEMLGLVKGILADGVVSEHEVNFLRDWILAHPDGASTWPVSAVRDRIMKIFADGIVTEEERDDLAELLRQIVGGDGGTLHGADATTELPLDHPQPILRWAGTVFVFTGKMACGSRSLCANHVRALGGNCEVDVTRRTTYLVLGSFGSRDWIQTSFGRKIEHAVGLRSEFGQPALISEEHWATSLGAVLGS